MDNRKQFDEEMLSLFWKVGEATQRRYWPRYFLRGVRNKGGLVYAKEALSKRNKPQTGLQRLIQADRPDLTVEALVLREEYQQLFSMEELAEARNRLASIPESSWGKTVGP